MGAQLACTAATSIDSCRWITTQYKRQLNSGIGIHRQQGLGKGSPSPTAAMVTTGLQSRGSILPIKGAKASRTPMTSAGETATAGLRSHRLNVKQSVRMMTSPRAVCRTRPAWVQPIIQAPAGVTCTLFAQRQRAMWVL